MKAAAEQPAPAGVSEAPPIARAVSGRSWRFDRNPMRIKSLTLKFDDPQSSYEYELADGPVGAPAGRFGGPLGFDGRFAMGGRLPYGPSAARGALSADGASLVLEIQTLGDDDVARATLVFGDKTLELSAEWAGGFRAKVQGRAEAEIVPLRPELGATLA